MGETSAQDSDGEGAHGGRLVVCLQGKDATEEGEERDPTASREKESG